MTGVELELGDTDTCIGGLRSNDGGGIIGVATVLFVKGLELELEELELGCNNNGAVTTTEGEDEMIAISFVIVMDGDID